MYNNELKARFLTDNNSDEFVYVLWAMYNRNTNYVDFAFSEKIYRSDVARLDAVKRFIESIQ